MYRVEQTLWSMPETPFIGLILLTHGGSNEVWFGNGFRIPHLLLRARLLFAVHRVPCLCSAAITEVWPDRFFL